MHASREPCNTLPVSKLCAILCHMEKYSSSLDSAFHALADPTRRAVVTRLLTGAASVTELASPFAMGLPTFLKHLKVLEESGLIASAKVGRVRTCTLQPKRLAEAESWLTERREFWEARLDSFAAYVESIAQVEKNEEEK